MISASQINDFGKKGIDYEETETLKKTFLILQNERASFYLTKTEFDQILRWKLRGQYSRQKERRSHNSEELIQKVTGFAFSIEHSDDEYELELKIRILTCLRGVGVPVASAILALVYPHEYAVIDYRGWRQVFGESKTTFTIPDYKRYLGELRLLSDELDWPIQEVDLAIWEYDRIHSK